MISAGTIVPSFVIPVHLGEQTRHVPRNNKCPLSGALIILLAERAGFEPAIPFRVYTLSRRAPSTTRTPLQKIVCSMRFQLATARRRGPSATGVTSAYRHPHQKMIGVAKVQYPSLDSEYFLCIPRRHLRHLFDRQSLDLRQLSHDISEIAALIPFTPERRR
jgi:hypothetical protein